MYKSKIKSLSLVEGGNKRVFNGWCGFFYYLRKVEMTNITKIMIWHKGGTISDITLPLILRILKWISNYNKPGFFRVLPTELQKGFHPMLIPHWLFVFHIWCYFLLLQRAVMTQQPWPQEGPSFPMKTHTLAPPEYCHWSTKETSLFI